jgi:hypothetical protein
MSVTDQTELPVSCFTSRLPYDGKGCGVAVVFCSDGRFGDHVDDFVQNGLGLHGYDRLAIAGGPACLAGHFAAYRDEEGASRHLHFLAGLRGLTRVILISHEDCGFYKHVLKVSPAELLNRIRIDLAAAVLRIGKALPRLKVEAYVARLTAEQVWFETVIP